VRQGLRRPVRVGAQGRRFRDDRSNEALVSGGGALHGLSPERTPQTKVNSLETL
jgi:ribosomal protein L4